jgi:hypothetical protein
MRSKADRGGWRFARASFCLPLLSAVWGLNVSSCVSKTSQYDKLCRIYEEYSPAATARDVAAVKITERVERELPEIYDRYLVVVMNSVEGRYDAFRELAHEADQPSWSCDAIRQFYSPP